MDTSLSVSRDVAVPAGQLYDMVADVTRMGEWSPENQGGRWLGGDSGPRPGARFRASNRAGSRSWQTVATVTRAEPGHCFSFRVTVGPIPVADWSYTFEPRPGGCRVTESWTDRRPGWFKPLARLATGVADRESHNRDGMEQTLAALAAAAEAGAPTT